MVMYLIKPMALSSGLKVLRKAADNFFTNFAKMLLLQL